MSQRPAEVRFPSVNLVAQTSRRERVNAAPRWHLAAFGAVALAAWAAAAAAVVMLMGWNPGVWLLR